MDNYEQEIIKLLKKEVKLKDISLERPPKPELGDYAFPCFVLAKEFKKDPKDIARYLKDNLKPTKSIKEIKAFGPYLNFFVNKDTLIESTLKKIIKEKDKYGSSNLGKKKKLVIEHTSINPNASPHVGRARNALIGDSLVRIHKFQNYDVETHFWVNDVGKQIAMLILGSRNKKNIKFNDLLKIYVDINKKLEKKPELEKEALALINQLEKGDKKIRNDFKKIVNICIDGQKKLFGELGIKYDFFDFESEYLWSKQTDKTLKLLEKTGRFFFDKDNRFVLDEDGFGLGMRMPVLVLTRGDGTSLYPLRDITYALDNVKKGTNIVVFGEDHKLYSEQINAALKILEKRPRKTVFYSFILLQEEKMSTRKGNVVLLEDFMQEAVKKAKKELENRYNKTDEKTAKIIAYGALKYSILKVSPEKNVIFSWQQALNFEGESCPYIQYAYARISSILRKHGKKIPNKIDLSLLDKEEETEIIKELDNFTNTINHATENLRPHLITTYTYELAKKFNEYYHKHNILKEKENLKNARLLLISCIRQVLQNGLNLLGIDIIERM
jgi:arginyl-tRNA synthetase